MNTDADSTLPLSSTLLAIWLLTAQLCIYLFEGLLWPLKPTFSLPGKLKCCCSSPQKIAGEFEYKCPSSLAPQHHDNECQTAYWLSEFKLLLLSVTAFNHVPLLTPPFFWVSLSYPSGNVSFQGSKLYTLKALC